MHRTWIMTFGLLLLVTTAQGKFISGSSQAGYEAVAKTCKDMNCVENLLQTIDQQIAQLVTKRMAFVKQRAALKARHFRYRDLPTGESISIKARQQYHRSRSGSPGVNAQIFKEIYKQSEAYEKQLQAK